MKDNTKSIKKTKVKKTNTYNNKLIATIKKLDEQTKIVPPLNG